MKKLFLGVATLALLLMGSQTASAGPRFSVGFGPGGAGLSYGTRVGGNGFLSLGYGAGFGYGGYGYGYRGFGYPGYGWAPRSYGGYSGPRYYPYGGYRRGYRGW